MGVIPQIQSIDEATDQIRRSSNNYTGIYWILTLIMFVLYFFYRQYKRRNIKSKIALRKRDSVGNVEDDPELSDSIGASPTIGLEMKSITATRILPTLRGLPTSKTGIKATSIIDKSMLENIVRDLPTRYAICDWNLIYSSQRDGYSLQTCLGLSKNRSGPSLLAIKDNFGYIFGAFVSETIEKRDGYYGTGETFVATFFPRYKAYFWADRSNQEFIVCENGDYLALGGGGNFALHLDKYFKNGMSESSKTFNNAPLSKNPNFKCIEVELWGFAAPY